MRRGTTPTITITTDIDLTQTDNLYLTFSQGTEPVFEKEKSELEISENQIVCTLTQQDTLALCFGRKVRFQIRATIGNKKIASNIMESSVEAILKDGEI